MQPNNSEYIIWTDFEWLFKLSEVQGHLSFVIISLSVVSLIIIQMHFKYCIIYKNDFIKKLFNNCLAKVCYFIICDVKIDKTPLFLLMIIDRFRVQRISNIIAISNKK